MYPLYAQQSTVNFSAMDHSSGISTINYEVNRDAAAGTYTYSAHYYHGDQIGSARLMTSGLGWPIWQGTFLPFGEEYNPQISSNNYKFTGMEHDSESGLEYYGARHYGSTLARFLSPDLPFIDQHRADPQSWNLYSYARNNPIKNVDPSGNACVTTDNGKNYHNDNSGGESCEDFENNKSAHPKVVEGSAPQADPQSALFQAVFHSPESQATWRNSAGFGNTLGSLLTFHWVAAELDRETANFCAGVAEYGECSVAVAFPGEFGAAETSVTILEQEGNIVHLVVKTPTGGEISVITEMTKEGDQLILRGTHIQGSGPNTSSLSELRAAARALGRQQGAKEVVIEGGRRTSGANAGKMPMPIKIKVDSQ